MGGTLPQPEGTLTKCVSSEVETTKIIKEWHEKVNVVLRKRHTILSINQYKDLIG
jgi:hypothetical protein